MELPTTTAYLRLLHSVTLAPTSGTTKLAHAGSIECYWIDPNFQQMETSKDDSDTPQTAVMVYEMTRDGTFADIFGSFGVDYKTLGFSQGQIVEFLRSYAQSLRQDIYGTFFLFQVESRFFIAHVLVVHGQLKLRIESFERGDMWDTDDCCRRVIVPQLAV